LLGSPVARLKASPYRCPPSPQSPVLPLADLLTTFSSVRCVLSFFSAFRDDDLELVHVRGGRRAARLPVQRRAGRQILLVTRPQVAGWGAGVPMVIFRRRAEHRHSPLDAERLLDLVAFGVRVGVAQRRQLFVDVREAALGLTGDPERAARQRERDGGDEGTDN